MQEFVTNEDGLALQGLDPVTYFSDDGPVLGSRAITTEWRGASFRFASAENQSLFQGDPERFAPQFGGHCAFGLSMGQAVSGDSNVWTVRDGKLYLNASPAVRFIWRLLPGVVDRAERSWAQMQPQS